MSKTRSLIHSLTLLAAASMLSATAAATSLPPWTPDGNTPTSTKPCAIIEGSSRCEQFDQREQLGREQRDQREQLGREQRDQREQLGREQQDQRERLGREQQDQRERLGREKLEQREQRGLQEKLENWHRQQIDHLEHGQRQQIEKLEHEQRQQIEQLEHGQRKQIEKLEHAQVDHGKVDQRTSGTSGESEKYRATKSIAAVKSVSKYNAKPSICKSNPEKFKGCKAF